MICLRNDGLLMDLRMIECTYLNGITLFIAFGVPGKNYDHSISFFFSTNGFAPHQRGSMSSAGESLSSNQQFCATSAQIGRFLFLPTNGFMPHQRCGDSSPHLVAYLPSFFLFYELHTYTQFGSTSVDLCFSVSCFTLLQTSFAHQGFAPVCTENGEKKVIPRPSPYFDVLSLLSRSLCEQFMEALR